MQRKFRELGLIAAATALLTFEAMTLWAVVPMASGALAPGLWAASAHAGTAGLIAARRDVRLVRRNGSVVTLRRLPVVVGASTCPRLRVTRAAGTVFSAALREALL